MRNLFKSWQVDWVKINLALFLLVLSLLTRFVPLIHPDKSIAFDEAYFIPQSENYAVNHYYFDIHPPLGKILLFTGSNILDPNIRNHVDANKVSSGPNGDYVAASLEGSRLIPRIAGSFVPVFIFLLAWEFINWRARSKKIAPTFTEALTTSSYVIPLLIGILAVFENSFIVDSRYALLTQILFMFMLGGLYHLLKYYNAEFTRLRFIYLVITAIFAGLAVSTKWLGLSFIPFIFILIVIKELQLFKRISKISIAANIYTALTIILIIPTFIYLASFAWHFSQIKTYSGDHYIREEYKQELLSGHESSSLWYKIADWHVMTTQVQEKIPTIDYDDNSEIGSIWLEWPIMIRPILYAIVDTGTSLPGYVFLIGNPVNWGLGLLGILALTFICLTQLLEFIWNLITREKSKHVILFKYWLILGLYLANWLPFAFIHRVMYLYHYLPALIISFIAFALILHDKVLPNINKLLKTIIGYMPKTLPSYTLVIIFAVIVITTVAVFCLYSPLTYGWSVDKDYINSLALLKQWDIHF